MAHMRTTAVIGLAVALLLALAGAFAPAELAGRIFAAHGVFVVFAFLIPALQALNLHAMDVLVARPVPEPKQRLTGRLIILGAGLLAVGALLAPTNQISSRIVLSAAALLVFAGCGMLTGAVLREIPKRGNTVVDIARDPLTKGDDACLTQIKFAHFFLPLGAGLYASLHPVWGWTGGWVNPVWLAGAHILLLGYALVSTYALCHLWVPRLSGVPAVAAGAIKGELHSTLLGIVLLTAGFVLRTWPTLHGLSIGLLIAGGISAFFGTFTFMGVLGANIMKNKSPTQRVTPQFAYIPWVFTGVFWAIAGVLLGVFLNAVPKLVESSPALFGGAEAGLRFAHVHSILQGGAAQLFMGLLLRIAPRDAKVPPLPFSRTKWAFYAWNTGFTLLLVGALGNVQLLTQLGAGLACIGTAAWFMSLRATDLVRVKA